MEKDIPGLKKSMHKVTIFHNQESLQDNFDLLWKIIGFWDACSGIFTEMLDSALQIR